MSSQSSGAKRLRENLCLARPLRILEAHSPLAALLAEEAADRGSEFDGFWSSSLSDSTLQGMPDMEILSVSERIDTVRPILAVTDKPLIMDGDTGGHNHHFAHIVRKMERAGVAAVIVEDKTGVKRNSLLGTHVPQQLADPEEFGAKIRQGKRAQRDSAFMIIARLEGLVLDSPMRDVLERADSYVEAGADAIMIHSRAADSGQVVAFAKDFRGKHPDVPLVCVPTTYGDTPLSELEAAGFSVVIYANHMLRASAKAMKEVAKAILEDGTTTRAETHCLDLQLVLNNADVNG
ncbi:phosphoenolpyruvate mutase [Paenarthrobacter sp. UW852]|uniref:phosphoenolpyruvate mutase n=1 Tax=Paenarthrobacter sp. UW852 TaxID=2951989 RepID=UPI002147770E|nr:phosphoenolpyruvate mutase [Paenarthrobacter sp. UW852]MCR1162391.1 phosphoenolpyruvate mutase [Paenarthrobacter sp. UW852]